MIRKDCNHDYWKEKFISGLPIQFAEKVIIKLKDRFEGKIPYEQLTFGDLISFINIIVLELCTNMKLKNQLKRYSKLSRKELGDFCQDFGYTNLVAPSNEVSKKVKHRRKSYKDKHDKPHYYKRKSKKSRKSKLDNSNTDTCWNCGKTGHHARSCWAPNKKKDNINMLVLEDEIKNKLYLILDENQTSSEGSSSEDDQLNMIYSSESNSSVDCGCGVAVCTCQDHSINVINSNSKEIFFDMVEHIEDSDYKKKYLTALKDIILNQQYDNHSIKPFSMTNVLNKFREQNSETTLQDLQTELVHVKKEIKEIKQRLNTFEETPTQNISLQ